jgi:hypothetical protein
LPAYLPRGGRGAFTRTFADLEDFAFAGFAFGGLALAEVEADRVDVVVGAGAAPELLARLLLVELDGPFAALPFGVLVPVPTA